MVVRLREQLSGDDTAIIREPSLEWSRFIASRMLPMSIAADVSPPVPDKSADPVSIRAER